MENQHRKIKGYRELSQTEIDLMNQIKTKGVELQHLFDQESAHINIQIIDATNAGNNEELNRIDNAEPRRWLSIARTHFQEGSMAATRAIAQPEFF